MHRIPSTLKASEIIIALARNNRCTNFNRRKFFVSKKVINKFEGFFVWPVTVKYIMVFVFPFWALKITCINHVIPFCGYLLRICFPMYGK